MNRNDPAVYGTVCIADMLRLPRSKLKNQQILAVTTENLGALVLVRVSNR
jgi:hypothetical protein